ncbi:MAG: FG-GAP-like repeat-containing protein [Opitutaceae bacterium]
MRTGYRWSALAGLAVVAIAGLAFWLARTPPEVAADVTERAPAAVRTATLAYESKPIGDPIVGRPWIAHLVIADLDADGLPDVLACDALTNSVRWLRQSPAGVYTESQLGETVKAPAHVEPCDIDRDGDLDLLVASMGVILPSNDSIGAVVVLENSGDGTFRNRVIAGDIARVTDVSGADFESDGDIDLAVAQFGYAQGEIRWMRNEGNWNFTSQRLLGLSGAIHTPVGDLDGDGRADIAALVSQEWEEIHIFQNRGASGLRGSVVWGSTNEDYGSSGLALADVDQDGDTEAAIEAFRAGIAADPALAKLHGNPGVVLAQTGRLREALPSFEKLVALDPQNATAHLYLGGALLGSNRPADARRVLERGRALAKETGDSALLEQIRDALARVP